MTAPYEPPIGRRARSVGQSLFVFRWGDGAVSVRFVNAPQLFDTNGRGCVQHDIGFISQTRTAPSSRVNSKFCIFASTAADNPPPPYIQMITARFVRIT
jgi:hypothetical protein